MEKKIVIGVDIGGSHISCAAVDVFSGTILKDTLSRVLVNNKASASKIISVWTDTIINTMEKVSADQVSGIGFAMPGPFDYVKGICYIKGVAKYENLYGFNITDAILSSIDVRDDFPVRFINDASAFAVGEAWKGSAVNFKRSLSVTFGTGFGSAFIDSLVPVVNSDEVPEHGCLYHLPYKEGIADDYFSSRGLLSRFKVASGKELTEVSELSELALNDRIAADVFTDFGICAAQFLAPWLKKFNADILVAGGNISNSYNLFGKVFEATLRDKNCNARVVVSQIGDEAALKGSAYLFNDSFWNSVQHSLPLM
jgi:glucokinase